MAFLVFPAEASQRSKNIALLSAIDQKIELNNRINGELETMAKTLYDYWFVQFDFPNEEGKPYKSSGGKMVYNTILKREVPKGWEVKTLDKISIIKAGGDKPKTYSKIKTSACPIPIYSNSITDYGIYGYTNKAEIVEPSITISARGTIGVGFLRIEPFTPIIRLIVITPYKKNYLKYIDEYLRNIQIGSSGSVQRQLTIPEISLLNIICPEQSLLDKYNNLTSCIVEKIENVKKENLNLQSLRDFLLPMLMNGQVTVK